MEPLYFLIAILGCGEGDSPCDTVRTLETRYESRAACTAATEAAAMRNTDVEYPVVVAQCVKGGSGPDPVSADEMRRPGPGSADTRTSPLRH